MRPEPPTLRISVFPENRLILAKLRQNAFFALLGVYVVTVVIWYAYNGVLFQFSLGLWALGLIPVTFVFGRSTQFVRELTPFIVLLLSYEALQGVAGSLAVIPVIHATASTPGFLQAVQSAFLSPDLTDVMTFFYGLHFPMIMIASVLLWYSSRVLYKGYVYSLVACSYISLLFYMIAPSAPPWYNGVVTNLLANTSNHAGYSGIIGEMARIGSLIESDKLAAFPSLHAAYAVLFGYFTVKINKLFALVSVPVVAGILFSTIYLGQHYVIDLIGGVVVASASVLVTSRILKRQTSPSDSTLGMEQRI